MPRRLPPLNALKAFEAAARLSNFTKAAQELYVTPSAVSQQVRSLENFLQVKLVELVNGKLILTSAGQRYMPVLQNLFDTLEASTAGIMETPKQSILSLTLLPTFAIRWLIPRLQSFQSEHPTINVRMITTVRVVDLQHEDVDLAIRFGSGDWPGLHSVYLMEEDVFPVCSPELAYGANPLQTPADLARHTLLHVETQPRRDDWQLWLDSAGVTDAVDHRHGHRFESSSMALRAATFSLGVAMAHRPFVEDDLRSGALVAPFNHSLRVDGAYYVTCLEQKAKLPKIRAFRDWLLQRMDAEAAEFGTLLR